MTPRTLASILLLSTPAFACTNCLISHVQLSSGVATAGAVVLLGRYREVHGWKAVCLMLGPFLAGTILGVASNLVCHLHYSLAPFVGVGVAFTTAGILGYHCPSLGKTQGDPGFTPESTT